MDVGLCVVDGSGEDLEELGNAVLREMWLMLMMELAVGRELIFGIEVTGRIVLAVGMLPVGITMAVGILL